MDGHSSFRKDNREKKEEVFLHMLNIQILGSEVHNELEGRSVESLWVKAKGEAIRQMLWWVSAEDLQPGEKSGAYGDFNYCWEVQWCRGSLARF